MFTGIVAALGRVESLEPRDGDVVLRIDATRLIAAGEAGVEGESIAINGACMTARNWEDGCFFADVSRESLNCTSLGSLGAGSSVNLERAMQATDRFGGHMVSGHVDGQAQVLSVTIDARSRRFELQAPEALARYVAAKGSVTLDGVSLTVNTVSSTVFTVNIIPHTASHTTIGSWEAGTRVNMEVDLVARYLERLLEARNV